MRKSSVSYLLPMYSTMPCIICNHWEEMVKRRTWRGGKRMASNWEVILTPFLNNNPVSGNYNFQTNTVFVVIDRSAKAGGCRDTLTGQFVPNLPETPEAKFTILLTFKRTGRQLALFRDF